MKRIKRFLLILLVVIIAAYLLGPKPPKPELNKDLPSVSTNVNTVESQCKYGGIVHREK